MEDDFDKKINKTLNEMPAPSDETLDTIWAGIENRIDFDRKMVIGVEKMKRNENKTRSKRRFITQLSTGIAAVFLVVFSLTTTPAKAVISEIISFFGSYNSQDYYSGQKGSTRIDAPIYESSLGYITYYDNQYFDVAKTDEMDRFVPKTDNGKGSSQSFFEVKLIKNATVQEAADAVAKKFKQYHSDVIVTDKSDKKNYSYLFNPLEGINIQAYDFEQKSAKGDLKKDSFYEFCSVAELKGIGTVSISYKYNVSDVDTSSRLTKLYHDIIIVNENTKKYMDQGPNLLVFDYDHSKYKLVKVRGEQYSYLSPVNATTFDPGILSIGHFYGKDIEKAAEELMLAGNGNCERKPTDISLKSSILVSNGNTKIYLIEDGQGGVFQLYFNVAPNEDTEKIIKSLRIVPQKGNEELMKPEELQNNMLG